MTANKGTVNEGWLEQARLAADAVDADKVIALTRDLVRIKSVFEPDTGGSEEPAVDFLEDYLRTMGLDPVRQYPVPNRPNLICDWQGAGFTEAAKTLMFEGHTDVVTEGDPDTWQYPPFAAELVNQITPFRSFFTFVPGPEIMIKEKICSLTAKIKKLIIIF